MAAYKFKLDAVLLPVDAQTVGEELERIYRRDGAVRPETVLHDSSAESAPLHDCFEWNDTVAAEKFRVDQARGIIRSVVVTHDDAPDQSPTRAFVKINGASYQPIRVAMSNDKMRKLLLDSALRDMRAFESRYNELSILKKVLDAMAEVRGGA